MTSLTERTQIKVYRKEYIDSLKEDNMWKFEKGHVIVCPNCNSEMVYKETKFGGMMGCKSYNPDDENTCKMVMNIVNNRIVIPPTCKTHKTFMYLLSNKQVEETNKTSNKKKDPRFWGCAHYHSDGCRFTINYDDWISDVRSHPMIESKEMWIRKGPLEFSQLPDDITIGEVIGEIYHALHDDYVDFLRLHIIDMDMYARKEKEESMGKGFLTDDELDRRDKISRHGPPAYDILLKDLYNENAPVDLMYIRDKTRDTLITYDEIYDEADGDSIWVVDIGKDVGLRGRRYIRIIRDLIDNPKSDYSIGKVIGYRKPFNLTYHVDGKKRTYSEGLRVVFKLNGVSKLDDMCVLVEK